MWRVESRPRVCDSSLCVHAVRACCACMVVLSCRHRGEVFSSTIPCAFICECILHANNSRDIGASCSSLAALCVACRLHTARLTRSVPQCRCHARRHSRVQGLAQPKFTCTPVHARTCNYTTGEDRKAGLVTVATVLGFDYSRLLYAACCC